MVAAASSGFSGRDVKKTCEAVERRHTAAYVRRLEASLSTTLSTWVAPTLRSDRLGG